MHMGKNIWILSVHSVYIPFINIVANDITNVNVVLR